MKFYTMPEVQKMLSISRSNLRKVLLENEVPLVQFDRTRRISEAELRKLLKAKTVTLKESDELD